MGHMDFQLFKAIVDETSAYGARSFSLHLFGEPLLYPKFFESVEYIKQKNRRHTILLTTNGVLVNKYIDRLIKLPIDRVLWTWRTESKFTKETKEKLKAWKAFTVRYIEEVTPKEAYEEGWTRVEGRRIHNYGGNIDSELFSKSQGDKTAKRWPCYHLWLAPGVAWDGNILVCCSDPHQKEVIGKFPETSIEQAWNSEKIKSIRESHLQGKFLGICKECDVWKQYPNLFYSWQHTVSSSGGDS